MPTRTSQGDTLGGFALDSLELARVVFEVIEDRKGEDLLLLDIQKISILADYFVIGSVSSERQASATVDSIKQEVRQRLAVTPRHIEGDSASGWMVLDYGDVVVHLFSPDMRTYYGLEELWEEGRVVVRML